MTISVGMQAVGKTAIIKSLERQIPMGSPEPQDPITIALLKILTKELIQSYLADGLLQENPYKEALSRRIHLNKTEIIKQLEGKVVLVTGGEGCVGGYLLGQLVELGAKRIISVDNARLKSASILNIGYNEHSSVGFYAADIRNYEALQQIFELEKPDVVFHLAAQRQPGLAEIQIRETISTNVFGTQNVIHLCERYGVKQCIFSSTGKASRYFTPDVYAGSKKLGEWLFAKAVKQGKVTYGMVRFTHIVENSIVSDKIDQGIKRGIVKLHSPNLYLFAQNNTEAANLLLNTLLYSKPNCLNFLAVRNLGWVVDILKLALFKILKSGQDIPLYFEGIAPGYNEPWFPGQIEPNSQTDVNPLINLIESSSSTLTACGDAIATTIPEFSLSKLDTSLSALHLCTNDPDCPEIELKKVMARAIKDLAGSIFQKTAPELTLKVLKLGVNPKLLKFEGTSIEAYKDVVEALVQGLYGRLNKEAFASTQLTSDKFSEIVDVLAALPTIGNEVAYLRAISNQLLSNELIGAASKAELAHPSLVSANAALVR